ncbi:phage tail tape measure protein [Streptomyces sp. H27-H1]|uniref:phage tail tape measure protein n=1 Tax=Streptomyces sp. H27-H1 TaxID=2996461 RepID=UPI00226F759A|nr:phage tail tape measure protein [Streptomyces sp. H27-H1]MCY0928300.1 phage tail tape measure protein [Streptomyces sp. H27-H1]
MTTRTVRVLLTGTVTPYVSAMRTAAATTTSTARRIEGDMRRAASTSSTALSGMARTAAVEAGRAGASIQRMAARSSSDLQRLGATGSTSLARVGASASAAATTLGSRLPGAASTASSALSALGGRATSTFGALGSASSSAAGAVSSRWSSAAAAAASRWPAAASVIRGSLTAAAAASGPAAAALASRWSSAGATVSARWAPVGAAIASSLSAAATISSPAAAAVASRWAAAGTAISGRWAATGALITSAMAAASASASATAGFVATRWAAAAAAVSGAFGSMRLAAFAAGAGILGVATDGRRSLEAMRMASMGLVAVFGLAAFAAARFDKAMSEVRAVTDGSASDMKKLSDAALQAGQATIYSATQAANAEAELARAGISTADIIGGALKGSLDLAASGQLELGESAIISAQAMNAFKLKGQDVGHIADVISAGAGKSATNVHHMGMAFRQAALLASQTGLSLEDTVGTLSLFAQNALTGSDAGTSLKVMLQRLVPQSNEAAAAMDAVGFSAYDASGNFIGLSALSAQMKSSFSKLTPEARNAAMATIFGSDAVRAATILYEAGAQGVDGWVKAVNDSGYATRVAATMTDNLAGDLERLKGALETALISSGSSANGVLRDMAKALTSVVNWYGQLNPSTQSTVTIMAGLAGIVGVVGTGLLLMLPRIMAVRAELVALGLTAARTRAFMMGLGRLSVVVSAIAAMSMGVSWLTERFRDAPPNVTRLTNALVDFAMKGKATGELSKTFGANLDGIGEAAARLAHPGTLDRIGDSLYEITHLGMGTDEGLEKARDQIKALDESLSSLVSSGNPDMAAKAFERMATESEKQGVSTEKLRTLLPQYSAALTTTDTTTKLAADSQKKLGDATAMTADEIADTRTETEKLKDALNALNGVAISAAEKEISFRSSLKELTDAVKENGYSLDVTTEKGRAVKGAFLDAASAALAHAEATAQQKDSVAAGNAVLEQDIAILRRQMQAAGFSKQSIDSLIGAYAQIPTNVTTAVTAPGARQATAEMEALKQKIASTPAGKTVIVQAPTAGAISELVKLGYKVNTLPDGRVEITVPTANAVGALNGLQARINSMHGTSIDITTHYKTTGSPYAPSGGRANREANGGYIRGYAAGGGVQYMPIGGPVYGPGTPTSDSVPTWLSTGEYVIKAASVRKYGHAMFDRLNAGRYAGGGSPGYTPSELPVLGGAGEARRRYDELTGKLRDAWSDYRRAVDELNRLKADKKSSAGDKKAAGNAVNSAFALVKSLDRTLGLPSGAQAPGSFNLGVYQRMLNNSLGDTEKWRASLTKIGQRGGEEIRDLLEGMGSEGYDLVNSLAGASDSMFKDIVAKIKKTGTAATATLGDFTRQLGASTKESKQFASDLQTLAARGFGDLAQALAAQGGSIGAQLARQAVTGNQADTKAANSAAGSAGSALEGEELTQSLVMLSTLRSGPNRGFAELIAAGLSPSAIRSLAPRIMGQINSLPAEFKGHFLAQLVGQAGGTAMARGGIIRSPLVLAGEAKVPEAYIPLNGSVRSRDLLATTARLMGYDARPAGHFGPSGGGAGAPVQQITRHTEVHLHGAKQSAASQAADIARHLQFVG